MLKSAWSKILLAVIILIFLVSILISPAINYYTDWLWFKEVNLKEIFLIRLNYKVAIAAIFSVGLFTFLIINLIILRRILDKAKKSKIFTIAHWIAFFASLLAFLSYALRPNSAYLDYLKAKNATPFNITDPILHKDVSYYVFQLPFNEWVFHAIYIYLGLALTFVVLTTFAYLILNSQNIINNQHIDEKVKSWFTGKTGNNINNLKINDSQGLINKIIWVVIAIVFLGSVAPMLIPFIIVVAIILFSRRKKITNVTSGQQSSESAKSAPFSITPLYIYFIILITAISVTSAISTFFVKIPSTLYASNNNVISSGLGFADATMRIPYMKISAILLLIATFLALVGAIRKNVKNIVVPLVIYIIFIIGGNIYYQALVYWVVKPNELDKERSYITNHIDFTRKAWNIDDVVMKNLTGQGQLTNKDIEQNEITFKNVRLWNRDQLDQSFSQLQSLRTYYSFLSVDNDRYNLNGEYRQVMLSAREMNYGALPSQSFINNHFIYTHGMGVVASPTNEVTKEGLPVLITKDIPPKSDYSTLQIKQPRIYFGEGEDSFIFTNTGNKEFDYPSGDKNNFASYTGSAGIPIDSIARKAAFAWKYQNMKILLSKDITKKSKIIFNRDILARAQKAYPFLLFDTDPYIVIDSSGHLKWMVDAYTATHRYPYAAQTTNGWNYARNSAKIVIDAYDGDINAYISDANDPIIQTYAKIFPGKFKLLDELPKDLQSHLRYPTWLFEVQAEMYRTYHMTDPNTFYNKEDQWDIPIADGTYLARHLIMKLPDESKEEYVFMLPYTPKGKQNLINWMVARNDAKNYGKLISYYLPKQKLTYGPEQIEARINQEPTISQQLTLWDQKGSRVVKGSLYVIPIKEAFIYIQPVYIYSESKQSIPEMKRVIIAYNEKIIMSETLNGALKEIFTGVKSNPTSGNIIVEPTNLTAKQFITNANKYYNLSEAALKSGDWKAYGEYQSKLKKTLEDLSKINN